MIQDRHLFGESKVDYLTFDVLFFEIKATKPKIGPNANNI